MGFDLTPNDAVRRMAMRIGAVFPQTEIGGDPVAIRDYAQAVESLGQDHLLAYGHVLGANGGIHEPNGPYTHTDMFHEAFVLYGYLAAQRGRRIAMSSDRNRPETRLG